MFGCTAAPSTGPRPPSRRAGSEGSPCPYPRLPGHLPPPPRGWFLERRGRGMWVGFCTPKISSAPGWIGTWCCKSLILFVRLMRTKYHLYIRVYPTCRLSPGFDFEDCVLRGQARSVGGYRLSKALCFRPQYSHQVGEYSLLPLTFCRPGAHPL